MLIICCINYRGNISMYCVSKLIFQYTVSPVKPSFPDDVPRQVDILEHSSKVLNFTADGNPSEIKYNWFKGTQKVTFGKKRRKRSVSLPNVTKVNYVSFSVSMYMDFVFNKLYVMSIWLCSIGFRLNSVNTVNVASMVWNIS